MMRKERKKRHPVIKTIIILAVICIASYGALIGYLCIREAKVLKDAAAIVDDYDALIVLGAQVKPDGTPSVQLEWRLDCAVEVWQKKQVPIVVCGAKGKDEPEPEANAMKSYLMGKGVPEYTKFVSGK